MNIEPDPRGPAKVNVVAFASLLVPSDLSARHEHVAGQVGRGDRLRAELHCAVIRWSLEAWHLVQMPGLTI